MPGSLLSDEDKARIRQEETLRHEIRQELKPPGPRTWPQSLWAFVNTQLGMWFLSAVVLTSIATGLTQCRDNAKAARQTEEAKLAEERRVRELTDRIALEISYRFSHTMSRLQAVSLQYGEDTGPRSRRAIAQAFAPLALPASDALPPLFTEFKAYSGPALIAELRHRSTGLGERESLKVPLKRTSELIYQVTDPTGGNPLSARGTARELLTRMANSRWDNGFPKLDCRTDDPFCQRKGPP